MIFLLFALALSVFLNIAFIFRFTRYNGEFYLNDSDPNDVKPVLKMDLDEWMEFNYIIIKNIKHKERK